MVKRIIQTKIVQKCIDVEINYRIYLGIHIVMVFTHAYISISKLTYFMRFLFLQRGNYYSTEKYNDVLPKSFIKDKKHKNKS